MRLRSGCAAATRRLRGGYAAAARRLRGGRAAATRRLRGGCAAAAQAHAAAAQSYAAGLRGGYAKLRGGCTRPRKSYTAGAQGRAKLRGGYARPCKATRRARKAARSYTAADTAKLRKAAQSCAVGGGATRRGAHCRIPRCRLPAQNAAGIQHLLWETNRPYRRPEPTHARPEPKGARRPTLASLRSRISIRPLD